MSSYNIMEPNLLHPLTLHLNQQQQQQQRSSLPPLINNSINPHNPHGYSSFPYAINNNYQHNHNLDVEDDEDDEDDLVDVDDEDEDQDEAEDIPPPIVKPQVHHVDMKSRTPTPLSNGHISRPSIPKVSENSSSSRDNSRDPRDVRDSRDSRDNHNHNHGHSHNHNTNTHHSANVNANAHNTHYPRPYESTSNGNGKIESTAISTINNTSTIAAESETPKKASSQGASSKAIDSTSSPAEIELLKENRELRKKVEHLMRHNMKLMQGIKDRDHKAYKHKLRLAKYRKALLRFFEQEVSEASSSGEELTDSAEDRKSITTVVKKERNPPAQSPSPLPSEPINIPNSPNSTIEFDYDDISPVDTTIGKKRRHDGDLDSAPDRKRRAGTRRNALWTSEDDEKFTQAYNTFGKSWKSIHECLPDKTREQVQSHGQYLIRIGKLEDVKGNTKRGRKKNKQQKGGSPTQPSSPLYTQFHSQHNTNILTPPPIPSFAP